MDIDRLHTEVLFTQVRVTTDKGGGSGTVIYSAKASDGDYYSTYVITCHHVIDKAIEVKTEWDPRLGRERKVEHRRLVGVEFFDWTNVLHGHRPLNYSADADVVAYDSKHDMALLKLRTVKQAPYVAKLMPQDAVESVRVGSGCVAVGCALLHDPIVTTGIVTHMGDEIDGKLYWMSNAQIIFGNSGGAVFVDGPQYLFIGIPSRLDVAHWSTPVTHMGYFSPITRVYEFFDEQLFHFLVPGHEHSEAQCAQERKELREREERRLLLEVT